MLSLRASPKSHAFPETSPALRLQKQTPSRELNQSSPESDFYDHITANT